MVLWTNDVLVAALTTQAGGFRLVEEAPHRSFGHDLVGQTWRLELARRRHPRAHCQRQSVSDEAAVELRGGARPPR